MLSILPSILFLWQRKERPHHSPSTIPQGVFLPRTLLLFTWYSLSLPTTAKGITSFGQSHFNMIQCAEQCYARFVIGKQIKHATERKNWSTCLERRKERDKQWRNRTGTKQNRATYSDLVIVTLVLHVLIKLFLGVKLNPAHLQFLPYLQHKLL